MSAGSWLKSRLYELVDRGLPEGFGDKLKALPTRQNEYGFDPFGFNREDAKVIALVARFFYKDYFRVETHGIEKVPGGRVLLIANHSGQLPFDGIAIGASMLFEQNPPRMIRAMVEKFVPTLPFASYLFSRWGQITGTPENCARLLEDDEAILVFPEGAKGIAQALLQALPAAGLRARLHAPGAEDAHAHRAHRGGRRRGAGPGHEREVAGQAGRQPVVPGHALPALPAHPAAADQVSDLLRRAAAASMGDPDDDDEVLGVMVKTVRNSIQSMLHVGLQGAKAHLLVN